MSLVMPILYALGAGMVLFLALMLIGENYRERTASFRRTSSWQTKVPEWHKRKSA